MIHRKYEMSHGGILETYLQDSQITYKKYKKKPAMIICPGGAYLIHATKEGEPVAVEFMQAGFQCFVLCYSIGTDREHPEKGISPEAKYPIQVLQLMEAMHLLHEHADEWKIDEEQIFVSGFSAGGHVAASLAVRWNDPKLLEQLDFTPKGKELKPAGAVLGYPMLRLNQDFFMEKESVEQEMKENTKKLYQTIFHTDEPDEKQKESVNLLNYISENTAPAFLWNCIDDPVVNYTNAMDYVNKCVKNGVACEYHLFSQGGHGLSVNTELTVMDEREIDFSVTQWKLLAIEWSRKRIRNKMTEEEA